jgi:hypothetical protein
MASEDQKNPRIPSGPDLETLIARAVEAQLAPRDRRIEELEQEVKAARALANADENAAIEPLRVKLSRPKVEEVLSGIPTSTMLYWIVKKKWSSRLNRNHFTLPIILEANTYHPSGHVERVPGIIADFGHPSHGVGTDMEDYSVQAYDLAAHPGVAISGEEIALSNANRKRIIAGERLPDDFLILPLGAKEKSGDHKITILLQILEIVVSKHKMLPGLLLEGQYHNFMREPEFFIWAAMKYAIRWSSAQLYELGQDAVKNPAKFDRKSGFGLAALLNKGSAGAL